jgi:hypothetical protein
MSSLFISNPINLSEADEALIATAYKLACDDLVKVFDYSPQRLADCIEPMMVALLALHRIGQRDEAALAHPAILQAQEDVRSHSPKHH